MDSTAAVLTRQGSSSYPATVTPVVPVTGQVTFGGATDTSPWERRLDPQMGVPELRWYQENLRQLADHEGRWIAILGQEIVASGRSMRDVRDQLSQQSVRDALIVRVPEDVTRREYFIG